MAHFYKGNEIIDVFPTCISAQCCNSCKLCIWALAVNAESCYTDACEIVLRPGGAVTGPDTVCEPTGLSGDVLRDRSDCRADGGRRPLPGEFSSSDTYHHLYSHFYSLASFFCRWSSIPTTGVKEGRHDAPRLAQAQTYHICICFFKI